jgi:hypothetical protein
MPKSKTPNVPFVQAHHQGRKQRPKLIVLRISETSAEAGAALGIADYWHRPYSDPNAARHYVIDESVALRCIPDNRQDGAGYKGSISVVLCAMPTTSTLLWDDGPYSNVLKRAADLVAKLCLAYRIPPRILDDEQVDRFYQHPWFSRGGLVIRVPGAWPLGLFRQLVTTRMEELK